MADRVVAMSEDAEGVHYLWDCGVRVTFNPWTKQWSKQHILHPSDIGAASPNREASPDVAMVDD
jgi:hypothetical protein